MTSHKHTIELEANKLHMCDVLKKIAFACCIITLLQFSTLAFFSYFWGTNTFDFKLISLDISARHSSNISLLTSGFYKSNFCWKKTKNKRYPKSEIFQKIKQKMVKPFHYSFSNRFLEFNSHAGTANRNHFNVRPFTRTHA